MNDNLSRAREYMSALPPAISGSGGDRATFDACRALLRQFHLSVEEAMPLLLEWNATCNPPWEERDLRRKLAYVEGGEGDYDPTLLFPPAVAAKRPPRCRPRLPEREREQERDMEALARIAESGIGLSELLSASPVDLDHRYSSDDFLEALFPGEPLLCLAKAHPRDALTMPRSAWKNQDGGPGAHAYIVPSPMSAETGNTQEGKPSPRCLENTGPRRFQVVEFDFKEGDRNGAPTPEAPLLARLKEESRTVLDLCSAILWHLAARGAPLVLVVHSGGKSLHGWFPTFGASDDALRTFFTAACRLGADPATWTRCQLVRIPEGTRQTGERQRVYYFNPEFLPAA